MLPLDWAAFLTERGLPERSRGPEAFGVREPGKSGSREDKQEEQDWETPPGGIDRDDINGIAVFCRGDALKAARQHGAANLATEVGGVLFGRVFQDPWETAVDVVAAVPAHGADGTSVHLLFTPAAWESVWRLRAALPDDLEMVGWYHTHPGLGVFLSATDLRTQKRFFPQPWHVALVLDPVLTTEGAFVGPLGREIAMKAYLFPEVPVLAAPGALRPWLSRLGVLAAIGAGLLGLVALTRRGGPR